MADTPKKDINQEPVQTVDELAKQLKEAKDALEMSEKRRKDTQAAYTKARQEVAGYKELYEKDSKVELTAEQQAELSALKLSDVDEWYKKKLEFENAAKNKKDETLKQSIEKAEKITKEQDEKQLVKDVFEAFKKENPNIDFDEKGFLNQIPPVYIEQVRNGEIDFKQFLDKTANFLKLEKQSNPMPATPSDNIPRFNVDNTGSVSIQDSRKYEDLIV